MYFIFTHRKQTKNLSSLLAPSVQNKNIILDFYEVKSVSLLVAPVTDGLD
jgi:hypothetical protein